MKNTACPIERSGGELSGVGSIRLVAVNDRIVFSRNSIHRHSAGSVSPPVSEFEDHNGSCRHEADCHAFGNAFRGLVYALLPSAVLWAILVGVIYTLVKR